MVKLGIKGNTIASYVLLILIFTLLIILQFHGVLSVYSAILIALIGTSIVCYVAVTRLVGPLEQITSSAYDIAGGILDSEIMVDTENENEFDELATSINVMAKQLRQNINKMNDDRSRVKAILDSMGDGVLALDAEGRVLVVNPKLANYFNIEEKKCVGKKVIDVINNEGLERLLQEVLINKIPLSSELRIVLNTPKIFKVYATPLKSRSGNQGGVVALISDITERRQLEIMRTDFVANVSHELKTPLTSIHGFLETLMDGAVDDKKTAQHFLEIMKTETDRLMKLIDDLLKLSILEYKKKVLDKKLINLTEIIKQVSLIFNSRAEEKGITLSVDIPDNLPPVEGERDLLMQVMVNLVDNAIKYIPAGKKVYIKAETKGKYLQVTVHDTGPGIPAESLPRLFERFYRVDKARSREAGGTGLGLAIAKHVVEVHRGEIWAESSPQGTGFFFTLPLH